MPSIKRPGLYKEIYQKTVLTLSFNFDLSDALAQILLSDKNK